MSFKEQMLRAKQASQALALLSDVEKVHALENIARCLRSRSREIISANRKDLAAAAAAGLGPMVDRLMLDETRLEAIATDVENVASLPDPAGAVLEEKQLANGLQIERVRVPIGVIGMIYESRPNVTVDAAVLALKSGNAVVLKGGKEALHSNRALARVMCDALAETAVPPAAVQLLDTAGREAAMELLKARGLVDLVIPRGGKGLIRFVIENATVPVIETGASVVHTYVDRSADIDQALAIIINEKTRRVSVCNALDTLLLHCDVADALLPRLAAELMRLHHKNGIPLVRIHAEQTVLSRMAKLTPESCIPLTDKDYSTEWLDYDLSIKIVSGIDDALEHIRQYSLGHSESVCAEDPTISERFVREVDAACVYVNSSTAFSDGAQFGLGAEIGISTQKLHARGPFALDGLCTYKWVIRGNGQVRP